MMSVLEYASEIGIDVNVVLSKCKTLGIGVSNENDYLSEDDVIILDTLPSGDYYVQYLPKNGHKVVF